MVKPTNDGPKIQFHCLDKSLILAFLPPWVISRSWNSEVEKLGRGEKVERQEVPLLIFTSLYNLLQGWLNTWVNRWLQVNSQICSHIERKQILHLWSVTISDTDTLRIWEKHRKALWCLLVSDELRITLKVKEPASRISPQLYNRVGLRKCINSTAIWNFLTHFLPLKPCSSIKPISESLGTTKALWDHVVQTLTQGRDRSFSQYLANAPRTCLLIRSSCPFLSWGSSICQTFLPWFKTKFASFECPYGTKDASYITISSFPNPIEISATGGLI